jgi:hypothetical protein
MNVDPVVELRGFVQQLEETASEVERGQFNPNIARGVNDLREDDERRDDFNRKRDRAVSILRRAAAALTEIADEAAR